MTSSTAWAIGPSWNGDSSKYWTSSTMMSAPAARNALMLSANDCSPVNGSGEHQLREWCNVVDDLEHGGALVAVRGPGLTGQHRDGRKFARPLRGRHGFDAVGQDADRSPRRRRTRWRACPRSARRVVSPSLTTATGVQGRWMGPGEPSAARRAARCGRPSFPEPGRSAGRRAAGPRVVEHRRPGRRDEMNRWVGRQRLDLQAAGRCPRSRSSVTVCTEPPSCNDPFQQFGGRCTVDGDERVAVAWPSESSALTLARSGSRRTPRESSLGEQQMRVDLGLGWGQRIGLCLRAPPAPAATGRLVSARMTTAAARRRQPARELGRLATKSSRGGKAAHEATN